MNKLGIAAAVGKALNTVNAIFMKGGENKQGVVAKSDGGHADAKAVRGGGNTGTDGRFELHILMAGSRVPTTRVPGSTKRFAQVVPGCAYQVEVVNRGATRVAAAVSVDGHDTTQMWVEPMRSAIFKGFPLSASNQTRDVKPFVFSQTPTLAVGGATAGGTGAHPHIGLVRACLYEVERLKTPVQEVAFIKHYPPHSLAEDETFKRLGTSTPTPGAHEIKDVRATRTQCYRKTRDVAFLELTYRDGMGMEQEKRRMAPLSRGVKREATAGVKREATAGVAGPRRKAQRVKRAAD